MGISGTGIVPFPGKGTRERDEITLTQKKIAVDIGAKTLVAINNMQRNLPLRKSDPLKKTLKRSLLRNH